MLDSLECFVVFLWRARSQSGSLLAISLVDGWSSALKRPPETENSAAVENPPGSITSSTITSGTPRRYASSRLIKIAGTLDFVAPTPPSHQVWMGREVADVRFSSPAARHFSFDDLSACAPRPPSSFRMRQDCGSHRRPAAAVEHPIGRGMSNPRPPRAAAVAIHCAQYKTRQTDNIVQVWTSNAGGADLPVCIFRRLQVAGGPIGDRLGRNPSSGSRSSASCLSR
jgi:hypothetical protein